MTVNYLKLNQVVPSIAAALPDGICCRSKSTHPLSPDMRLLIWQTPFSLNLLMRPSKECFFELARPVTELNYSTSGLGKLHLYTML